MPFDPKAHVGKFKDRDYMDVANRLLWINEDAPGFEVETDLIHFDETRAVVKATVTVLTAEGQRAKRAVAHGLAIKAALPAMLAPRYLEKAETSAVGRALSMLGYGTQYAQEFEDAADEHLADTPRERKPPPPLQRAPARAAHDSPLVDGAAAPASRAPAESAPAGGDYREPSEDEWIVWDDKVREQTGYSHADVCTLLGRSPADHLRALNADGTPKTGKALIADLIAYKREARPIPGVAVSAAVQHLQGDIIPAPAPNGSDVLGCQVCGNELEETKFRDGTSWTTAKLAEFGRKKHDMVLCMVHYREMNAAKAGTSAQLAEATAR